MPEPRCSHSPTWSSSRSHAAVLHYCFSRRFLRSEGIGRSECGTRFFRPSVRPSDANCPPFRILYISESNLGEICQNSPAPLVPRAAAAAGKIRVKTAGLPSQHITPTPYSQNRESNQGHVICSSSKRKSNARPHARYYGFPPLFFLTIAT